MFYILSDDINEARNKGYLKLLNKNIRDVRDVRDNQNIGDNQNIRDTENIENIENIGDIGGIENLVFVDNKKYDDIQTLELCKECCLGAIIGHSTFAWWGAYIINCPQKIVVCPNKFLKSNDNFSGLFLDYKVIDV